MTLWVYDPGRTTGFAAFDEGVLEQWGEFPLWALIDGQIRRGDQVAYERIQALHPSFDSIGIQVIGVICYLSERAGIEPVAVHPGSLVGPQRWPGHEELRQLAGSEHAYDSICHGAVLTKSRGLAHLLESMRAYTV